ncbi:MAG: hypothetical protein R2710_03615 [Acidimicrobiales bacterium]
MAQRVCLSRPGQGGAGPLPVRSAASLHGWQWSHRAAPGHPPTDPRRPPPGPLVNLSPYFEQRSEEYRHRLRSVSTHGAIDEWIQFFCEAIANQATEAQERIRRLLSWRDETVEVLRANGRKGSVVDLVPFLIEYPVITVKQAKSLLESPIRPPTVP